MKLTDNEVLIEEGEGWVRLRRSYLPATHTYQFKFQLTELYCPHCGTKNVWVEDGAGDYYVGPEHRCGNCGADFHLP